MKYLTYATLLLFGAVLTFTSCNEDETTDPIPCTESIWYEDADSDGLGNPDVTVSACEQPEGFVTNQTDDDDTGGTTVVSTGTPLSAFDEFNSESVTISFDGDEVTLESNGLPDHTSPYWATSNSLYIEPVIADEAQMSPGTIAERSYVLTVSTDPQLAASASDTGLGAIGIAVTGVPIFNDEEGPTAQLSENVASGFDYAGAHMGPTGYHYHTEAQDVAENTVLSNDDEQLVGILQDGFLLYGRRCNATGENPADLDESGGHTSSTQHSDGEEFYHYHIINEIYLGPYYLLFGEDLQGTPNNFQ